MESQEQNIQVNKAREKVMEYSEKKIGNQKDLGSSPD